MIHPEVRTYFRDVNDHLLRAHDQLEGYRDLLTSVLQANLTQVGVRQNEDMRKISAYVAMAAVPTLIAGHLRHELRPHARARLELGYPAVLLLMAAICASCSGVSSGPAGCSGLGTHRLPRAVADDCIFCKIAAGELPAEIVQEDEHTLAFMDLNPWTRGHALVIPRRHSRNLYEVEDEDLRTPSWPPSGWRCGCATGSAATG